MGTNGLFGFYYRGRFYAVYNHMGSYPEGLGRAIVAQLEWAIKEGKLDDWMKALENIKVVGKDTGVDPTPEDIEKLKPWTDLTVSTQSTNDWYCLLRGTQGDLVAVLEAGYISNCVDQNGTPMWVEYNYFVNLDTQHLDYYEGSTLVKSFPFDALPDWRSGWRS